MSTKRKTRIHFNRVNMQRGNSKVWTAHNSLACFQGDKIVVMHKGEIVLESVFKPTARQPRAYFATRALVRASGDTLIVEV